MAALKIWSGGLGIWGALPEVPWVPGSPRGVACWCRRWPTPWRPASPWPRPSGASATSSTRSSSGRPTVPWALEIDVAHRPAGFEQYATFHPTFLYESLWCLAVAGIVVWAGRRFQLGHGRTFALYVALYCLGRLGVELVRIDSATQVGGLRINVWVSVLVGLARSPTWWSWAAGAPWGGDRAVPSRRAAGPRR